MKFNWQQLLFVLVIGLSFAACSDDKKEDEPTVKGKYEEGVLIINEGAFMGGTGTLDFWDRSSETFTRNVYQTENNNMPIGEILQSATIVGDHIYLAANNAKKIEVADAKSLKYEATVTGLSQPRYVVSLSNDELLVSQWGSGLNGALVKVDTDSNTIKDTIAWNQPEGLLKTGDYIYVANNGGWGVDSTVSILDFNLNEVAKVEVGLKPTTFVQDKDGDVWVMSSGKWTAEGGEGASIAKISGKAKSFEAPLAYGANRLTSDKDGDKLYFIESGKIVELNRATLDRTPIFTIPEGETGYALGIDPVSNSIMLGTTDYVSESKIHLLNLQGQLQETKTAGIITNGFIFR